MEKVKIDSKAYVGIKPPNLGNFLITAVFEYIEINLFIR